ncbi:MAG: macrocin O-methyltransferase [Patescibacteria group bacterium]|nr:macrocin O-methyltransferase [Patescibacteria group bacterium]
MFTQISNQLKEEGFTNFHYIRSWLCEKRFFLKYSDFFIKLLEDIKEQTNMDSEEQFTLYSGMVATSKLPGEVAEVGVYKGGSAKILCETKGNKKLYLFDTFEGIPKKEITKGDLVKPNWLNETSLEGVKEYLKDYQNIFLYKGLFPETAKDISNKLFCFVHLDADTYKGTLEGLKFFWPKMVKGGRIVVHDYNNKTLPGVKKAFKEFFKDNPELIIDIADTQGMVIKNR